MEELKQKLKEIQSQISGLRGEKNSYHSLDRLCSQLVDVLQEMHIQAEEQDEKRKIFSVFSALNHTIGKEVKFAEWAYREMTKKNAAKIRGNEYLKKLEDAIDLIKLDLSCLL